VIVPFNYYLHDSYTGSERAEFILSQTDLEMDQEEFLELIGRPFYEVQLACELDTETGTVNVVSVKL
jgi:ABC-type uncharacterized transport system ATPase component